MDLDYLLFQWINGLAGRWPLLDGAMRTVVNEYFIPTALPLFLLGLWFIGRTPAERAYCQETAVRTVVTVLVASALLKLCNLVYFRPRPFAEHEVNLLFYKPWDSSFPSNPAVVGFAFAVPVFLRHRRLGMLMLLLAFLFSFSRIYCGVHYPLDVVAGALLGAVVGWWMVRRARFLDPLVRWAIRLGRRLYLA